MVQIIGALKTGEISNYIGYSDGEIYFHNPASELWVSLDMHYTNPENIDLNSAQIQALQSACPNFILLNGAPWAITNLSETSITISDTKNQKQISLLEVIDPYEEDAVIELIKTNQS